LSFWLLGGAIAVYRSSASILSPAYGMNTDLRLGRLTIVARIDCFWLLEADGKIGTGMPSIAHIRISCSEVALNHLLVILWSQCLYMMILILI
jgi:hypothetical protein